MRVFDLASFMYYVGKLETKHSTTITTDILQCRIKSSGRHDIWYYELWAQPSVPLGRIYHPWWGRHESRKVFINYLSDKMSTTSSYDRIYEALFWRKTRSQATLLNMCSLIENHNIVSVVVAMAIYTRCEKPCIQCIFEQYMKIWT